jgi:NADH:ubiquinone oxidoreductase subunit F (NADH-binding)
MLRRGADLVGGRRVRYAAKRGGYSHDQLTRAGLDVLSVPDRYVSSEESALLSLAHGGLARPMTKPAPIVFGATDPGGRALPATVVLNAETVLRIAQIEAYGPAWFRSFGTPNEPGPRLATLAGAVFAPGTVETAAGVRVVELIAAAGGTTGPASAVGIGGLSGGWLTADDALSATWSRIGLQAYGFTPGPGTVLVLASDTCPIAHVSRVLEYAAGEPAGQCGPCMFGVPAVAEDIQRLADSRLDRAGLERLRGRLGLLPGRGACRFPDGVSGYARSALQAFPDEIAAHTHGSCATVVRSRSTNAVSV